jgi:GTPase
MSPLMRRVVGWSCIAVGKVGSLVLLWLLVVAAEPGVSAQGPLPLFVLFAMTAGVVVVGIRVLMQDDEGSRKDERQDNHQSRQT